MMTATTNETTTTTTHEDTRRPTARELIKAYRANPRHDGWRAIQDYFNEELTEDEIPGAVREIIDAAKAMNDYDHKLNVSFMLHNLAIDHHEDVCRAYIQYDEETGMSPTTGLLATAMVYDDYSRPRIARGTLKTLKQANRDYTLWNEIIPVWESGTNRIRAIRREDLDETHAPDGPTVYYGLPRHIEIDTCLPSPNYWTREYLARGLAAKLKSIIRGTQDDPDHGICCYVNYMVCQGLMI